MKSLCSWKGVLNNGISSLKFSANGKQLAAAGTDPKHYVAVFDVYKKLKTRDESYKSCVLGKAKGGGSPILDISWSS